MRTSIAGLHVRIRRSKHSFRQHELKSISEVWLSSGRARRCCLGLLHVCEEFGRQHAEDGIIRSMQTRKNAKLSQPIVRFLRSQSETCSLKRVSRRDRPRFASLSQSMQVSSISFSQDVLAYRATSPIGPDLTPLTILHQEYSRIHYQASSWQSLTWGLMAQCYEWRLRLQGSGFEKLGLVVKG